MSEAHCNKLPQRKALGLVTHDNTGGPFVVECQGCGEVYPSFHCLGGAQIADTGDQEDARCPHCDQVDPEECDNAALAWNTQQLKINELQQRLNAADQRIDELTRPNGEQVAHMPVERCYDVRAKMIIAFNEAKKSGGDLDDALDAAYKSALRFSPNPLATEQPDRSPENYAIEHAEYMAKSADVVLAKFQAYGLALLAVDEGGDDGEGELLEAIDSTRQDLQESGYSEYRV